MIKLKNEKCLVAGSFDPVTLGHQHIIGMASMTFKEVVVAIGVNDEKKYFYTLSERLSMLQKACARYDGVKVTSYEGLTADFMRENGIKYFVRGARDEKDASYEEKVFKEISKVNPDVELILFSSPKELKKVSSTAVREAVANNSSLTKYLPYEIIEDIEEYNKSKKK